MIYICGDSFAVSDPDYGPCWADMLANRFPVVNLAQVCASNLLISLQVDAAIEQDADYIIYLATASTRSEAQLTESSEPLLQRFQTGSLTAYSLRSLDETTQFNPAQLQVLKQYYTEFFDLPLAIYHNQCIIANTLDKLTHSQIPFKFDQGGFEHVSYAEPREYFARYQANRSKFNLWDWATTRAYRPYYHITDVEVHEQIANYYTEQINDTTR